MPRRSPYEDEFEYNDEDYDDIRKGVRRLRKEPESQDKKKKWDRETLYDKNHDYDERR